MRNIALQLYTVREETARDFAGTLEAVAAMGYPAVELAGYGGLSAGEARKALAAAGLEVAGSHVSLNRLEQELETVIKEHLQMGRPTIVCPWVAPDRRGGYDQWRALAATLDRIGERCRARGLDFCYHHHDFEFALVDERPALERLLEWTRPENVGLEIDVYWVARAGYDPAEFLRKWAPRIPLVHLKDVGADGSTVELGAGGLDFAPIFAAAEAAPVRWFIVEQDESQRPPLESVATSLRQLQEWGYVSAGQDDGRE